jgi:hypothetical protein
MSASIRFPLLVGVAGQPAETADVITLATAVTSLLKGGQVAYASITQWHSLAPNQESPFTCVSIEFSGTAEVTIGTGANPICLFGEITLPAGTKRVLLGVLGINFGGTNNPQIRIIQQADGTFVGFAQITSNIACYDAISVGGLTADITIDAGAVTIVARPIRRRDWVG